MEVFGDIQKKMASPLLSIPSTLCKTSTHPWTWTRSPASLHSTSFSSPHQSHQIGIQVQIDNVLQLIDADLQGLRLLIKPAESVVPILHNPRPGLVPLTDAGIILVPQQHNLEESLRYSNVIPGHIRHPIVTVRPLSR